MTKAYFRARQDRWFQPGQRCLALALALGMGAIGWAEAADEAETADEADAQAESETTELLEKELLEKVVVTGSRLPQPKLTSTSPFMTVDSTEARYSGRINVEDILNTMPQVAGEFTSSGKSGINNGFASVNLRNLGSERTLVLLDGKRMVRGSPLLVGVGVNVDFIPMELIDGVDVLTGGSSGVYGSDALAGVVNFKMKRDFEGLRVGFNGRSNSLGDGNQYGTHLVLGINSADGAGNVTAFARFAKQEELPIRNLSSRFNSLLAAEDTDGDGIGDTLVPSGFPFTQEARFTSLDRFFAGLAPIVGLIDPDGSRSFVADDGRTNPFVPTTTSLLVPSERYHLGAFAHYQFSPHLEVYSDFMFMDTRTNAAFSPAIVFFQQFATNCDNPLLSQQQQDFLCNEAGLNSDPNAVDPNGNPIPVDNASVQIDKLFLDEFGIERVDGHTTQYRIVLGARGDIVPDLMSYDVSAQRSEVSSTNKIPGISLRRVRQALQVTTDQMGNPVCKPDPLGDPDCVPLDMFQLGQITQEQVDFIGGTNGTNGGLQQELLTGALNFDFTRVGGKSPWANTGAQFGFGLEYRTEALQLINDEPFATADFGNPPSPVPDTSAEFTVRDVFGELRVPIVDDRFLVHQLTIDGAYRASNFNTAADEVRTYKGGVFYAPVPDISFRGNVQRATRAPSIREAFGPQSVGLTGLQLDDPCSGTQLDRDGDGDIDEDDVALGAATFEECARTGVTEEQYQDGSIPACPSGQCGFSVGANPDLEAERSITRGVGTVIRPRFLPGFSLTVDYWSIDIRNPIGSLPALAIFNQCVSTGDPGLCSLVHRGDNGGLGLIDDGFVQATLINVGSIRTRGYDFNLDYLLQFNQLPGTAGDLLSGWGGLRFSFTGTRLKELRTDTGALPDGSAAFDCAGLFGLTCNTPSPKWKHVFRMTWNAPMGVNLSFNWRHIGGTSADVNEEGNPNLFQPAQQVTDSAGGRISSRNYLDITFNWDVPRIQGLNINIGANNVTDTKPPKIPQNSPGLANTSVSFGNTFANVYDFQGVQFFAGITYEIGGRLN